MAFDPSSAKPAADDPDSGKLDEWLRENSPGVKSSARRAAAEGILAAFRGGAQSEDAMREILRHSAKVLPQAVRKGIRREWYRAAAATDGKKPTQDEFWAENGTKILNERFTGRGSWRAQAKKWLHGAAEHVQRTAGLRDDTPVLQALSKSLNATKEKAA